MCHKSLPLTFIFSVLAIFTISIITQRDLQADEQAELGRDVIWTQWDAANFTLIDDGPLLWVGTGSGLVKYEKGTGDFSRISKSEGLPLNYVTVGIVDSGGNRWFGGDTGLVKLDSNNKWTHYDSDNSGLLRNHVDKIALAANGDLWLGHGEEEKISHRRADGFWKIYPNVKQTVVQAYADVKQTINPNKLWAVSGEEVWVGYEVYNGDRWEKRTPEEATPPALVDVQADSKGTIWALETDKVFNWDGQKWSPYWNDLDPTEYFHEEHFLLMAIDGDDEVWVGGSYYFEDPIGPPGAPEEDTYFARLPENPGSITAKSFLDEESHIRALLPKEEGVWGIGRDWFLKADGEKSSLGALPNKIASVIVDHGGSTWLNAVISTYFNDYHFLLKFEDQGTGKMDDDQLPYFFPFPNSNVVVELVDNGDFWVSGTNKYYSGSQAEIPPWRAQSGERIEYDFLAGKPAAADIFSEDTQHTWFIYAANDGDQAGYLPAILRLDDGGTPADFDDDRWTEYRGPHHVNSMEDLHVATANGRLWYGDSSGVYLYLDPGWEQLAEEKPKRLVPTAGGILFVDLGEDQVLVIEPEGDPYYRFVASLVRLQPERILSTSRSNEMWTVAKDGAIWYWQGANQMIRRRRLKEWHYESPIGRQPIQVDGNNHVWMTYDENLWRLSPRPSFDVTVNPPTWFIKPEASQSGKIVPIHISGYDGEISLRADQLPSGISAEIEPEKVGVGETALLTLSAEDIPLGAYSLKIRGTSGGVTRSRTVKIYVVEEVYEVQLPLLRGNY